jgi:uncharacterized protein
MSPSNPFVAGARLQDLQKFVGREEELRAIASLMSGDQPTSVNIVGDRRIGKSSLLYYFSLTWHKRVLNPNYYVVVYLSLQGATCQSERNLYQAITRELQHRNAVRTKKVLIDALNKIPFDRLSFAMAVGEFKKLGLLPVLCLDDFESLFKHPQEFNNGFYDSLRAMMDDNAIMLVIASRKPLHIHADEHRFVSGFFNLGHTIKLGELTIDEAIELTRLSINTSEGKKCALTVDEQHYALQWGKRYPYLLQLAGLYLWEAHQNGKDIKWAKDKFDQQLNPSRSKLQHKLSQPWLRWSLLTLVIIFSILIFSNWKILQIVVPSNPLVDIPKNIGGFFEDISRWFIGCLVLTLPILFLTGMLPWQDFVDFVHKLSKKILPWEEIKDFFNKLFRK